MISNLEIIGVLGGLFYLVGFIEIASGYWDGKSFWYEITNIVGSLLLGYYAIAKHAYINIVLNLIWGIAALYALRHIIQRHKIRKSKKRRK